MFLTWNEQMEEISMINGRSYHKTVFDEDNNCFIIAGVFDNMPFTSCEILDLF